MPLITQSAKPLLRESFVSKALVMYVLREVCRVSVADVKQEKEIHGSKFLTELRAGLTTFFTMAYIIAVNVSFSVGGK